jgi:hypothetical protein
VEDLLLQGKPNQTVRWLEKQGPEILTVLRTHLSKKLPRSQKLSKIEDHVSKFLEDLIRRDSIGKRNRKGKKTSLSQVKAWCVRNSHTQNRDAGVDALGRCMHGALTRKEWTSREYGKDHWAEVSFPKSLKSPEQVDLTLLESNLSANDFFDEDNALNQMMSRVRDSLQKSSLKAEDIPVFMKLTELFFIQQEKVKDIAKTLGLEDKKVTYNLNKLKKILRRNSFRFKEFRN